MMAPPLLKTNHKKIYIIGVDAGDRHLPGTDEADGRRATGAEIVGLSKMPAGTTDFQQFVLAAQDAAPTA